MWYFMAGMEQHYKQISGRNCEYGLMTFLSLQNKEKFEKASEKINNILIDSGAYSFIFNSKKASLYDFDSYCEQYIKFIKDLADNTKIIGFFELDIDRVIGYDKVLEYRKKLESVSDKIIPVWHANRGINDYIEMCKKYSGKRIAIATVGWHDLYPEQLNLFINTAHKYGCKIHILGMTRFDLIANDLNLGIDDSFDSVSWALASAFASVKLVTNKYNTFSIDNIFARLSGVTSPRLNIINYLQFRKIQDYFYKIDNSLNVSELID